MGLEDLQFLRGRRRFFSDCGIGLGTSGSRIRLGPFRSWLWVGPDGSRLRVGPNRRGLGMGSHAGGLRLGLIHRS